MSTQPDPQPLATAAAAVALEMQNANRRVNQAAHRLAEVSGRMAEEFHGSIVELLEALSVMHELAGGLADASAAPEPPAVPLPGDH